MFNRAEHNLLQTPDLLETPKHTDNFPFMVRSCTVPGLFSYTNYFELEFCRSWIFLLCKCSTYATCITKYFPCTESGKSRDIIGHFSEVCVFFSLLHDLMLLLSKIIGAHIQYPTALRDFGKWTALLYCSSASLHSWSRTWPWVCYSYSASVCDHRHPSSVLKGTVTRAMISFSFPVSHTYHGKTSRCKIHLLKKSPT